MRQRLTNRLRAFVLGREVWWLASRFPRLRCSLNRFAINQAINVVPARPYRLSTKADYTSWETLTDKRYNARELPASLGRPRHLPKSGDVVELFRRRAPTECKKSTVLFAYVAQWFTDGFLRSDRSVVNPETGKPKDERDITRNESTHEVDLAQLYGLTPEVTEILRCRSDRALLAFERVDGEEYPPRLFDGSGKRVEQFKDLRLLGVHEDTVKENTAKSDYLAMGSDAANTQIGYAMLNTLFLREHNWIAREIRSSQRAIGEPWNDDRVFAAARNVSIVLLIKLAIEEYINHITPYHFQFSLDPTSFEKQPWQRPNWMAVEFNLLYRWHSLIPSQLELGGSTLGLGETMFKTRSLLTARGLGPLFEDASRQHAGAIGLFNTADELLHTELQSIEAGRKVRLAGYNDYREHCKLGRVTTFEQISSCARVVTGLRELYHDVDDIEFYVGLFAEDHRPNSVTPPLIGRLVGLHAFSQLLTNPLLSPAVYKCDETFSRRGREIIEDTRSLQEVVERNVPERDGGYEVRLTHAVWSPA